MSKQVIKVSDATFRAIAAQYGFVVTEPQVEQPEGFQVGDTVQIIGDYCHGLIGELKVIDEHNTDEGDFFGIEVDGISGYVFFREDEIKRVDVAVEDSELPF